MIRCYYLACQPPLDPMDILTRPQYTEFWSSKSTWSDLTKNGLEPEAMADLTIPKSRLYIFNTHIFWNSFETVSILFALLTNLLNPQHSLWSLRQQEISTMTPKSHGFVPVLDISLFHFPMVFLSLLSRWSSTQCHVQELFFTFTFCIATHIFIWNDEYVMLSFNFF